MDALDGWEIADLALARSFGAAVTTASSSGDDGKKERKRKRKFRYIYQDESFRKVEEFE